MVAISAGLVALVEGSVYNASSSDFVAATRPITETLRLAAPLILAGLGIALGFRVGLFNIGGTGQLLAGAAGAAFVSTKLELPIGLHLLVAILAAVIGAAFWGGIVGFLKARTGAHEVIVTIMMNYIALSLVSWMMRTPGILQDPEVSGQPQTAAPLESAQLPTLLGSDYALHAGLLLAVAATILYWWVMERSVLGFTFRMVGKNEAAAKVAGVNVQFTYILAMAFSAGFVGLAAANQALGRSAGFPPSLHGGIGFDAITVALLGGGSAVGVFLAGL
jgi:simple sugar transport system permease protein